MCTVVLLHWAVFSNEAICNIISISGSYLLNWLVYKKLKNNTHTERAASLPIVVEYTATFVFPSVLVNCVCSFKAPLKRFAKPPRRTLP